MFKITSRHLFFFIPGVTIVAIKTYVTLFTMYGGRDTWIALFIASIMICIYFLYLIFVCNKKKCYDILKIYQTAVGKWIGIFLIIIFFINLFLNLIECTSVESSTMNTHFIVYTPFWLIALIGVLGGFYVVKSGASAVISSVIIGIIFISTSGFILFLLTWRYKDFNLLLPILEHGVDKNFLICIVKLLAGYSGVAILLTFLDDVVDPKLLKKISIVSFIYVTQIHLISMTGVIATFEINVLNTLTFPKLLQTQLIRQFDYLEAGELFVMLQVVGGWFVKYIITLYAAIRIIDKLKIKRSIALTVIIIGNFIGSYYIGQNKFILFPFLDYLLYISLVNYIAIPLLVFSIFLIRKKKVQ